MYLSWGSGSQIREELEISEPNCEPRRGERGRRGQKYGKSTEIVYKGAAVRKEEAQCRQGMKY